MAEKYIKQAALRNATEVAKCYANAGFSYNPSELLKELYETFVELIEESEKES